MRWRSHRSYYPSGALEWENRYDSQGRLHGRSAKWAEDGQLLIEDNYRHGKAHGRSWEAGHPEGWYWNGKGCYGKANFDKLQARETTSERDE